MFIYEIRTGLCRPLRKHETKQLHRMKIVTSAVPLSRFGHKLILFIYIYIYLKIYVWLSITLDGCPSTRNETCLYPNV